MNYNSLMNKPSINYRELIGDNSVSEVGGITEEQFNTLLNTDLSSYYTKAQIDDLFSRSYVYREKSGSIVTFDCPASVNGINKVVSEIVAVQSGTGDPSPTNVRPISGWSAVNRYRTEKNLFFHTIGSGSYRGVTYTFNSDGTFETSDTSTNTINLTLGTMVLPAGTYFLSGCPSGGGLRAYGLQAVDNPITTSYGQDFGAGVEFTLTQKTSISIRLQVGASGVNMDNLTFKPMVTLLSQKPDDFVAYSGQTYTTALKDGQGNPLVCYGGTLTNENGVQSLTLTHGYIASYNGETLPSTWISDRDVYVAGTTPTIGAEVVYELETPLQIPQDSLSIVSNGGINNIWSDSGDITVKTLDKIIQE